MKTLGKKEQRKLIDIIAEPLKDEGVSAEMARPTIITAVREFTLAYRRSFGITITDEQADDIRARVAEKLG